MIDAAQKGLEDGSLDSYGVELRNGLYFVTVVKGGKDGAGQGPSEEDAYKAALKAAG